MTILFTRHASLLVLLFLLISGCISAAHRHNQQGLALFQAGRYDQALQQFQQAAHRDITNADAHYNIGSTYHRLGNSHEAELGYMRCLALNPDHAKCRHAMVVLLLERGRDQEAYESTERWLKQSPNSPDALVELAWLERKLGNDDQGECLLQQALVLDPRHIRALAELAARYERQQQLDQALVLYQRALAASPGHPALIHKVASLRQQGFGMCGVDSMTR